MPDLVTVTSLAHDPESLISHLDPIKYQIADISPERGAPDKAVGSVVAGSG
jgi:hypothetical protein